ncbi:TonB-dependent receptor plug domain-containing protein [Rhodothermus marinus]|uniref:TonB-dependent receptor plug domain-containing protein n=1 Tax=Rhodothermus marinus TaxID=29549 RepID=UPI0012BA4CC6|nr:TonB-dependent receptor [Rhodothermus marinus]BBM69285.1 ligand-gated channel [Rhodothermus marinus]BBM72277.1 ligand-gated channel [Rhodothermus marinus]
MKLLLLLLLPQVAIDTTRAVPLPPVVITATRSMRAVSDVPVPVQLVPAEAIRRSGAARLSDVLAEQPGLLLFEDHGTGLMIQGFEPDYTLLLLDGEPVIGRTAGTLDLKRFTVQGLDRIEIVRGPTSSLYGSEALAGVVNLIRHRPEAPMATTLHARMERFGTYQLGATSELRRNRLGATLLLDHYRTEGYDLAPEVFGPTAPALRDYTADAYLTWDLPRRSLLSLAFRRHQQQRRSAFALDGIPHDETYRQTDWSLHPRLQQQLTRRLRLDASLYLTGYETRTRMTRRQDGALYYADRFSQAYRKLELRLQQLLTDRQLLTLGGGAIEEALEGDRYAGRVSARSGFLFAQHEWTPRRWIEMVTGFRFDAHSDYASRLSPRLAVLIRPAGAYRLRASIGSGFKAPDFRQRYLVFTNAAAGYSVFGVTRFREELARLQAEGQIARLLIDPDRVTTLRPESSVAFNLGGEATWFDEALALSLNLFHNEVRDLIDTQPVAQKTNQAFVYSYFNLDRIYTRGLEATLTAQPVSALTLSLSYQYLETADRDVLEAIDAGRLYGRTASGRDYRLQRSDYGGLFGRSRHSGTVQLRWQPTSLGLTVALRGVWRSRYGYRDVDGNGVPNRADEYVPGYSLWHLTVGRRLGRHLELQGGAFNLFDLRRPALMPFQPGRRWFVMLTVHV